MFKTSMSVLLLLSTSLASAEARLHIDVFYGHGQHIINTKQISRLASIELFDLAKPEQLEAQLSHGLPDNPIAAEKEAQRRVKSGGRKLQRALESAYAGILRASEYRITKLPAIVFNYGDDVIYGVHDVAQAVKIYREKKK